MPELPEVETIARTLTSTVEGRKIVACNLYNTKTLQGDITLDQILGMTINKPSRRGKLLLFPLLYDGKNTYQLIFHLKMTGRIFVYPSCIEPSAHTRVIFELDDGNRLFFDDIRKFGYVRIISLETLHAWSFWNKLGPEPLEIDSSTFIQCFQGRKGKIKSLLLDQSVIAGCGNIYADESLFRAGISPDMSILQISNEALIKLYHALQAVFLESIAACGSSIKNYRTAHGDAGAFQNLFNVYGRSGKPCLACGNTLQHMYISGRRTVWCSQCQI